MPVFRVTIVKPVQDLLRGFFDVEAASAEEAAEKLEQAYYDHPDDFEAELSFWQCADCLEAITFDAEPLSAARATL